MTISEIVGVAQNYDWGSLGSKSKVAQLGARNGLVIDESKTFAELWMGTVKIFGWFDLF
jgi:mannose-6-phosphate isomerase